MKYVLDTNIILHFVRNTKKWQELKARYDLQKIDNQVYISIVTFAEIKSLAKQLNWGPLKMERLEKILFSIPILNITVKIAEQYVEIDVYSQGKDLFRPLPSGLSSRNMGKNDLWIAASASFIGAILLTTDYDFDHLNLVFLNVQTIQ
jgi:predicted nucleic acid-binding protein